MSTPVSFKKIEEEIVGPDDSTSAEPGWKILVKVGLFIGVPALGLYLLKLMLA